MTSSIREAMLSHGLLKPVGLEHSMSPMSAEDDIPAMDQQHWMHEEIERMLGYSSGYLTERKEVL